MKHVVSQACAMIFAAGALGGCASTSGNPADPLEGFNRAMFSFNEGLDKVLVKPAAQAYEAVVPLPARTGFANVLSNIADPWTAVNNLVQGKPDQALADLGRFLINSTVGILGLFDVAAEAGMEKREEDFGQTLGRWGVGSGPYLVLPVVGPRTIRDTFGFALDSRVDLVRNIDHVPTRNLGLAGRAVSDRTFLLGADTVVEEAALDKYAYVRSAYLQRRRSQIYDGNPPREPSDSGLPGAPLAQMDPADAARTFWLVGDRIEPSAASTVEVGGAGTGATPAVAFDIVNGK